MEKSKILIIDDEVDFGKIIKMNLEESGDFTVEIAKDGKTGIKLAQKIKPNLILLDVRMPGMDGFQVLEKLKKSNETLSIPVVMLSAMGDDFTKGKASELYGEEYITKPIDIQALKVKIKEILTRDHF
jgi:DNA-binding response OmpR family regulator